jgi:hypothetical protein
MLIRLPLIALLAVAAALADPFQVTLTGVNGANAFGYYVGPYYGQFEGQSVSLYCDDFANEVAFGQKWMANLSKITAGSDLSNTRFGGLANALQDYQEIAWLDMQFATAPVEQYGDIHATIWDIFDPGGAPRRGSPTWLALAQQNYQSMVYDNFRVLTNVGPVTRTGQVQEFLIVTAPRGAGRCNHTGTGVRAAARARFVWR